jgi:hypothetical protein
MSIRTHDDLDLLVNRLHALAVAGSVPPLAEIVVAQDPYTKPYLYLGIGVDCGWVREPGEPDRWTVGPTDTTGTVLYDYVGHGQDIPARHVVPLPTVRAVLAAYLDHDGVVPDGDPHLRPADT